LLALVISSTYLLCAAVIMRQVNEGVFTTHSTHDEEQRNCTERESVSQWSTDRQGQNHRRSV